MALVSQLDRLNKDPDAHPDTEAFSVVFSRLGREISAHFETEEAILRSCGMPADEIAAHVTAHTEILEQYARLNLELMAGRQCSRTDALDLVRNWIVGHDLHHDIKIAGYLAQDSAAECAGA